MDLRNTPESENVEDLRGQRGTSFGGGRLVRGGGGLSLGSIAIIFVVCWLLGINPLTFLAGGDLGGQTNSNTVSNVDTASNDDAKIFASKVLTETETVWTGIFSADGQAYPAPTMTLFRDQVRSACGFASAASGPFYCPGDRKLYIDLSFYDELDQKFGASGDFAQAYVLAHEVGHHVQNLIGVLPKFNQMRQNMSEAEANAMSVRVELQADCFAGIWGHFTQQKGILDVGDLDEALNAAQQIGDDTMQRKTQGYVVPESFNHGTSAQRSKWFKRGFDSGKLADCDTFSGNI
ncbi:neutral zinc metallopeptidase [Phyllobacterium sp. SB3]|uniref:KPN_02809 family neutral zinc metallopeptidase n=1 Tax=Phyllobacterium sp. SB3 TaxID=3156073 RepID=UPI0032B01CB7